MEPKNDDLEDVFPLTKWVIFRFHVEILGSTPLKTNMSPENQWLVQMYSLLK